MKKFLSLILTICMVISLFSGIGLSANADTPSDISITGVTVPIPDTAVSTAGIAGAPDGFDISTEWQKFDYNQNDFAKYTSEKFEDDSVYKLYLVITAKNGRYISFDDESIIDNATINGEAIDDWGTISANDNGLTEISIIKHYIVGDITVLDEITISELPAEAAGTSTAVSEVKLPDDAKYTLKQVNWYTEEPWGNYTESTLAKDRYSMYIYVFPKEGYWISPQASIIAPKPETSDSYFHYGEGFLSINFSYDTRNIISEVNISGDWNYAHGDKITVPEFTLPIDAKYTVDAKWQITVPEEGYIDITSETFSYGNYYLMVTVNAKDGTELSDTAVFYINGLSEAEASDWYVTDLSSDYATIEICHSITPENGFIEEMTVKNAPDDISAGEKIKVPELKLEGENASIAKIEWVDENHKSVSGKFKDKKVYYLAITFDPADGYGFDNQNLNVKVVKENKDSSYYHGDFIIGEPATVYVRYSLLTLIKKVEFNFDKPEIGAKPSKLKTPKNAKYSIANYFWYDEETYEVVDTFKKYNSYFLEVEISPADGYEFSHDTVMCVNGEEQESAIFIDQLIGYSERFSFKKAIKRAEITMPVPKLGGTFDYDDIKIPEDAKYSLSREDLGWNAFSNEFNGTFEKDKYSIDLILYADKKYEFTDDTKFYLNGELYEDFMNTNTSLEVYYSISFRDIIKKVEFPSLPTVKVGDQAIAPDIKAPTGAHYFINASWAIYESSMSLPDFNGDFEDKNAYYLQFNAYPEAGYEFSEDVKITVGGKEYKGRISITDENMIYVAKLYSFGLKVIDKIELKADTPEIGKAPSEISIPKNANYSFSNESFSYSKNEDSFFDTKEMKKGDVFETDKYYWLFGIANADSGYIFSDELAVTFNGKDITDEISDNFIGIPTVIGDTTYVIYKIGKITETEKLKEDKNDKEDNNDTDADIPPTGDNAPVNTVFLILMLSAVAFIGFVSLKKKFKA